jgi:diaminohydroxyphosphoribosylaminopyrimidine deaminase / 5-amino-6-(5-phosphoribosylamino)uracil reductase
MRHHRAMHTALTAADQSHLQDALALAQRALTLSNPNPRVGCVLVGANGAVLARGHTQAAGQAHAEAHALAQLAAGPYEKTASFGPIPAQAATNFVATGATTPQPVTAAGATAYVTLEPCSHHGRTPPCADALVAAGVARVVVALIDPNPLVAGRGVARLRAAGVRVDVLEPTHPLALAARDTNIGFLSRMQRGRPWIRAKVAASLDGVTALGNGVSQWITSPAARADGHLWRARACAVLTGIGTVLADNPRLDVRHVAAAPTRQPHLVVVDSALQTPPNAALWAATQPVRQVWVYASAGAASPGQQAALQALGGMVHWLPAAAGHARAKLDLAALMGDLAQRQVNEVHVEAGAKLLASLARAQLIDEWLVYLAPTLLGTGGAPLVQLGPLQELSQGVPLRWVGDPVRVGPDLRLLARTPAADDGWPATSDHPAA